MKTRERIINESSVELLDKWAKESGFIYLFKLLIKKTMFHHSPIRPVTLSLPPDLIWPHEWSRCIWEPSSSSRRWRTREKDPRNIPHHLLLPQHPQLHKPKPATPSTPQKPGPGPLSASPATNSPYPSPSPRAKPSSGKTPPLHNTPESSGPTSFPSSTSKTATFPTASTPPPTPTPPKLPCLTS